MICPFSLRSCDSACALVLRDVNADPVCAIAQIAVSLDELSGLKTAPES